jgi:hypothetical protein
MGDDDFEYTDMDEKVAQEKMTKRHEEAQKQEDMDKEPTLEELDDEPAHIEGGDDEWAKPEEGADLDSEPSEKEDKEEKEEPEEEVKEEKEEVKEETAEEKKDKEAMEDMLKYLDEDGGGTKYVIKGKEYDLRDLSPQEFKDRFSKAGRFYQRMEELSAKEKTLTERERLAEEGARRSQEIMRKYGDQGTTEQVKVPDALKVREDDMDEVKALKEINAELYTKLGKLEQGYQQQAQTMTEQELYRQLDTLTTEFPMASKEEIVAVKYNYPDADLRTIAENSHNNRMSDDHFNAVTNAHPDKIREIEEKAIEKFLAKKQTAKRVSRKKSSSTVSSKSSDKKTRTPRTFDEIEAREEDMKKGYEDYLDRLND